MSQTITTYQSPLQRRPSLVRAIHRDASAPKDAAPCSLDKIPVEDLLLRVENLVNEAFQVPANISELLPHPIATHRRRIRAILSSLFRSALGGDLDPADRAILDFDVQVRKALVFCFLRLKDDYSRKTGGNTNNAELHHFRAVVCEVLAVECVQFGGWTMEELQTEVLTYRFRPAIDDLDPETEPTDPHEIEGENALECGIRTDARLFYKTPAVADCIRAIWAGRLRLIKREAHVKGEYVQVNTAAFPHPSFVYSRAAMPIYQYFVVVALRLVNLVIYSTVIFNIADPSARLAADGETPIVPSMSGWEICLYLFTFSFILHSSQTIATVGWKPISGKLWFWVDTFTQVITLIAFIFRMLSVFPTRDYETLWAQASVAESREMQFLSTSLNLLSCIAPLVWLQLLNYLDLTEKLGPTIVILRGMLSKFMIFLPFAAFTMIGIAQGVIGLVLNTGAFEAHPLQPWEILKLLGSLAKCYFGDSGYTYVKDFSPHFGQALMMGHHIIGAIMVGALSAVMIQAFQTIVQNKDEEYFFYFSFRILDYFKETATATEALAMPPFTVLQIILAPIRLCSKRLSHKVDHGVVLVLLFPFVSLVAIYEAWRGVDSVSDVEPSGLLKGATTSYNQKRGRTRRQKRQMRVRDLDRSLVHEEIQIVLHSDIEDGYLSGRTFQTESAPSDVTRSHIQSSSSEKDSKKDTEKPTLSGKKKTTTGEIKGVQVLSSSQYHGGLTGKEQMGSVDAARTSAERQRERGETQDAEAHSAQHQVHDVRPSEVARDSFRNESDSTQDRRAQAHEKAATTDFDASDKNDQHDDSSATKENQKDKQKEGSMLSVSPSHRFQMNPWSTQYEDTDEDVRWKSLQDRVGHLEEKLDRILTLLQPASK